MRKIVISALFLSVSILFPGNVLAADDPSASSGQEFTTSYDVMVGLHLSGVIVINGSMF